MTLSKNFTRDVILKAPSKDIMNTLTKSCFNIGILNDDNSSDISMENVLRQCLMLKISVLPMMAVYGYHGYNHYCSMMTACISIVPDPNCSMAENILRMLQDFLTDNIIYRAGSQSVDIALLVLHMEHGGGK